jgi:hypothetical protein
VDGRKDETRESEKSKILVDLAFGCHGADGVLFVLLRKGRYFTHNAMIHCVSREGIFHGFFSDSNFCK